MRQVPVTGAIRVGRRFNGPHDSGNGGYAAGLIAAFFPDAQAVEATIRAPIPLEEDLHISASDEGLAAVRMTDPPALILSARAIDMPLPRVRSPGGEAARAASQTYRSTDDHVLPHCFVCGPARHPGDGLRIFPDWLPDQAGSEAPNPLPLVAAPWRPWPDLGDASGCLAPEFIWAALDCPGAFALNAEPILLGRITARILRRPQVEESLVVVAWRRGAERRKHFAGSAIFDDKGGLIACSEQTWIAIEQHAPPREV